MNLPYGADTQAELDGAWVFYSTMAAGADKAGLGLCVMILSAEGEDASTAQVLATIHTGGGFTNPSATKLNLQPQQATASASATATAVRYHFRPREFSSVHPSQSSLRTCWTSAAARPRCLKAAAPSFRRPQRRE